MGYSRPRTYTISINATNQTTPLDSTTYYFGSQSDSPTTVAAQRCVYIPKAGFIRAGVIISNSTTATGTNEDIVMVIRLNNTTDYTFATVGSATQFRVFSNQNLNIPLADGDYIEMKVTYPAWATNPEGTKYYGHLIVETA